FAGNRICVVGEVTQHFQGRVGAVCDSELKSCRFWWYLGRQGVDAQHVRSIRKTREVVSHAVRHKGRDEIPDKHFTPGWRLFIWLKCVDVASESAVCRESARHSEVQHKKQNPGAHECG